MTGSGPSAADVATSDQRGRWSLTEKDLFLEGIGKGRRHYTIEEVREDKLVLRQVK